MSETLHYLDEYGTKRMVTVKGQNSVSFRDGFVVVFKENAEGEMQPETQMVIPLARVLLSRADPD